LAPVVATHRAASRRSVRHAARRFNRACSKFPPALASPLSDRSTGAFETATISASANDISAWTMTLFLFNRSAGVDNQDTTVSLSDSEKNKAATLSKFYQNSTI